MLTRLLTGRHRAASLAVVAAVGVALVAGPATARSGAGSQAPVEEPSAAELKGEYDEVMALEAEMLEELEAAQREREQAAAKLARLQAETRTTQLRLVGAQAELEEAEAVVDERLDERRDAERRVFRARERLRKQIVATFVTGGDQSSTLEAFLQAQNGDEVGQALTYGRAISSTTEEALDDLEEAQSARREAARAARSAQRRAEDRRDEIAEAALFLVEAQREQRALVGDLNLKVVAEADALRKVQGRKALVEGRINAMNRVSDGVALLLADRQREQPDWTPGSVLITTPMPGTEVGSKFGPRLHPILGITRLHAGVDMGASTGEPIYAAADGIVVLAEARGGFGNTVVLDHGSSLATLYAHNSELLVEPGDLVLRGTMIARAGSTGLSTGPHLHFETRIKGLPIDPEGVIDFSFEVDYEELARQREREARDREARERGN